MFKFRPNKILPSLKILTNHYKTRLQFRSFVGALYDADRLMIEKIGHPIIGGTYTWDMYGFFSKDAFQFTQTEYIVEFKDLPNSIANVSLSNLTEAEQMILIKSRFQEPTNYVEWMARYVYKDATLPPEAILGAVGRLNDILAIP